MVSVNNITPIGLTPKDFDTDIPLLAGLLEQTAKYDTSTAFEMQNYSPAPLLIRDANISDGCDDGSECGVPDVVKNSTFQMRESCNMCLLEQSVGFYELYGIDRYDPKPTQPFIDYNKKKHAMALPFSAMKTYWLGNPAYVSGDLHNVNLLPAYKKDKGQWFKISETSPPTFTIAKNSAVTKAAQLAITYAEVLEVLDAVIDQRELELKMISNDAQQGWLTVELFDTIQKERSKNELAGIRFVPIENAARSFESFVYRDFQFIKYDELSAAIKDVTTGVADTLLLPHRVIFTVGLPKLSFPIPTEQSHVSYFHDVTKKFNCATIFNVNHPDAVQGNYYSLAY